MANNKTSEPLSRFYMTFSEASSVSFMRFFDQNSKVIQKVLETWSKPVLDASNAMFCRMLAQHGLLKKNADGKIILSYIVMIYVEVLKTVMHYGANADIIAGVKQLFDYRQRDSFTTAYTPLTEILFNGHNGLDIEFTYTYDGEFLSAYDCNFAPLFLARPHDPCMQFSLIPILNSVRGWFKNLEPIEVKHSMYDVLSATSPESKIIDMVHDLKDAETLKIKNFTGENGKYHTSIEREVDNDLLKKFDAFCNENNIADFTDIVVKRRKGGVANAKMSEDNVI